MRYIKIPENSPKNKNILGYRNIKIYWETWEEGRNELHRRCCVKLVRAGGMKFKSWWDHHVHESITALFS